MKIFRPWQSAVGLVAVNGDKGFSVTHGEVLSRETRPSHEEVNQGKQLLAGKIVDRFRHNQLTPKSTEAVRELVKRVTRQKRKNFG